MLLQGRLPHQCNKLRLLQTQVSIRKDYLAVLVELLQQQSDYDLLKQVVWYLRNRTYSESLLQVTLERGINCHCLSYWLSLVILEYFKEILEFAQLRSTNVVILVQEIRVYIQTCIILQLYDQGLLFHLVDFKKP